MLERASVVADGMIVELSSADCGGAQTYDSGWSSTGETGAHAFANGHAHTQMHTQTHTHMRPTLASRSESHGGGVVSLMENERRISAALCTWQTGAFTVRRERRKCWK